MARNETEIEATAEQVWAVLADAHAFPDWVVGARRIRAVDPGWPQPGTAFHHEVGGWPFKIKDNTKVRELVPSSRLVLEARARPAGIAAVTLLVEERTPGRTTVTILEEPIAGPAKLVPKPIMDVMTKARNAESMRRLRNLVEERHRADSTAG